MAYEKARIKLLDKNTGQVLKEVDPYTSADAVTCGDGDTVELKLSTLSNTKGNFVVGTTLPEIADRDSNSLYFKVTT